MGEGLTWWQATFRVYICPLIGHHFIVMDQGWHACKRCLQYGGSR